MMHKNVKAQQGFFPQPIYMIGSVDEENKPDFAPVTWLTSCSAEPPMMMTAMNKKMVTCANIIRTRKFSANILTNNLKSIIIKCGKNSAKDIDKIKEFGIDFVWGNLAVPLLNESPWIYECIVTNMVETENTMIFIGTVENIVVDSSIDEIGYGKMDIRLMQPLVYSPGSLYLLGESVEI